MKKIKNLSKKMAPLVAVMKTFCSILLILLFVAGCTTSTSEKHSGIPITVPLAKGNNPILLSDIVNSLQYIKLETTDECLIGEIWKIYSIKDKLIIFDRQISKSIYFFNQDGTFINKISRIGQGPREYVSISDIAINGEDEEIIIWDIRTQKLLIYNFDGTFVNNIEFPYYGRSIAYIGDNLLAMYCDYSLNKPLLKDKTSPNLVIFNLKTGETKNDLFFDSDISTQGITIINNNLSLFKGQVLLIPTLSNSIYSISKSGKEEKYYLDYGMDFQKKIADYIENLPNVSIDDIQSAQEKSNLPFIQKLLSSNSIIYLEYLHGRTYYYGFYYPESKTYLEVSAVLQEKSPIVLVKNDIDNTKQFLPYAADAENNFYYILQPFDLLEKFKDSENADIQNLIKNSLPDDNPIIVRAAMKIL